MADLTNVTTNYFATASETYTDNLSASISAEEATVPVNSANEYTDGDVVVLTVEPGTTNEATFTGVKASSPDRFTNCVWTEGNLGVGHASGSTIIDYDSATHFSMLSKGVRQVINQDGTLIPSAVAAALGGTSPDDLLNPAGKVSEFAGITAPAGWLLCDGATVSRTNYARLFNVISPAIGTITITISANATGTLVNHGLETGDPIHLTTTGTLPDGLSSTVQCYAIKMDANTIRFATTQSNANAGTAITTSGTQSGTHTLRLNPYGVGDGATTFNVPNLKGVSPIGMDRSQNEFSSLGKSGGAKTHTLTVAQMPAHAHATPRWAEGTGDMNGGGKIRAAHNNGGAVGSASPSNETGGGAAHNNLHPYTALNYIIKT